MSTLFLLTTCQRVTCRRVIGQDGGTGEGTETSLETDGDSARWAKKQKQRMTTAVWGHPEAEIGSAVCPGDRLVHGSQDLVWASERGRLAQGPRGPTARQVTEEGRSQALQDRPANYLSQVSRRTVLPSPDRGRTRDDLRVRPEGGLGPWRLREAVSWNSALCT